MEINEISEIPTHASDVDVVTMGKLPTAADRYMAQALSILRQDVRWASETALRGHNIAVQLSKQNDQDRRERRLLMLTILGAVAEQVIQHFVL